ncbi:hypothetical protein BDY24DRAFT_242676 [Mrakia frigida]|uniref:cyclin family protein n=1 Tax=Mrakia frigida TaxID=29902 RepID=UPI003FCBFA0C
MGGDVISEDAPLRIAFASFLLASKYLSEYSDINSSFVKYTPWSLKDINTMEKQLLKCLRWDLWISGDQVLHRASGFWKDHQTPSSSASASPPSSSSTSASLSSYSFPSNVEAPVVDNLFLMHRRDGIDELGWRGGLVRGSGEEGRRIARERSQESVEGDGEVDSVEVETTVWKRGRLERREMSDGFGREG